MPVESASKSIPVQVLGSLQEGVKQLGEDKMARSPVKFDESAPTLRKPGWIRVRIPAGNATILIQELVVGIPAGRSARFR